MGLLIMLAVGAALGWVAAVMLDVSATQRVVRFVAVGMAGAVATGLAISAGTAIVALGPIALFASIAGSLAALSIFVYLRPIESR